MRLELTSTSRFSFLMYFCCVALFFGVFAGGAQARVTSVDVEGETRLLELMNEERARAGRKPLAMDPRLTELARAKAEEMASAGYFDHVSPTYGTVYDMLKRAGLDHKWAGENIALTPNVEIAHHALMASPGHRANILSGGYTHAGIGVVAYRGRVYVCQLFFTPRI